MNFRTATLLIIGMFGSFSVIIVTMMVLFWPGSNATPQRGQPPAQPSKTPGIAKKTKTLARTAESPKKPAPAPPKIETQPAPSPPPEGGITTQAEARPDRTTAPTGGRPSRELRIEQDEIRILQAAMEDRLRQQLQLHERKLSQLARQCESLEPGAAAQVMLNLDDDTVREILKRMDRQTAINIAALLVRLGRATALPTHHEER